MFVPIVNCSHCFYCLYNMKRNFTVYFLPEESIIRDQNSQILRKMVAKLKPRYRKLLELRYFQEYSYDEIDKELELQLGTVKVQLFRSREMLFELLKNNEIAK